METFVVMSIVVGCTGYAVWTLMPSSLQRALAARFGRRLKSETGCGGCDGCGTKPITIHRRPPR